MAKPSVHALTDLIVLPSAGLMSHYLMEFNHLPKADGIMDEIASTNVSPYLLRPLRRLEEVQAQREEEQRRKIRPVVAHYGRFMVIRGGKS